MCELDCKKVQEPFGSFPEEDYTDPEWGGDFEDFDLLYVCIECGDSEVVKKEEPRKDGRICGRCGGHSVPKGYVGVDLARIDSDPAGEANKF